MTPEQVAASYAGEYGEQGAGDPGYGDCEVADTGNDEDMSAGTG
jgi:hypothetical protein